jgi:putative SOS response-associated peptidase YedK
MTGAAERRLPRRPYVPPTLTARYNVSPTQKIAVVAPKTDSTKCGLALLQWGLVPYWSNDDKRAHINAKAETGAGLSSFSQPFRHKRCIIPATGFYEWRAVGRKKVSHRFRLASGVVMGFAGLWDVWTVADGKKLITCCIITTAANELVASLHDRMPAILAPDDYARWCDHDAPLKDVHALLTPYPADQMVVSEASPLVNSTKNEGPQLLDPPRERPIHPLSRRHHFTAPGRTQPPGPRILAVWSSVR